MNTPTPEKKIDIKEVTGGWNKAVVMAVVACSVAFVSVVLFKFMGLIIAYAGMGLFVGIYQNNAVIKLIVGLFAIAFLLIIWAFVYPWIAILIGIGVFAGGYWAANNFFVKQS